MKYALLIYSATTAEEYGASLDRAAEARRPGARAVD